MKKQILFLIVLSVLVGAAGAVPTWRGAQGSTYQRWDFTTDANPAVAEDVYNPYALAPIEAVIDYAGVSGTDPVWSNGVWSGTSIRFTATIPNTDNTAPDSYKDLVVEIGYRGSINLAKVEVGDIAYSRWMREIETYTNSVTGEIWNIVRDYYHIEPNPTSEDLCLGFSTFGGSELQQLDYVMVDTICAVPAPGAILLGGIGTALVGWIKRRKTL